MEIYYINAITCIYLQLLAITCICYIVIKTPMEELYLMELVIKIKNHECL